MALERNGGSSGIGLPNDATSDSTTYGRRNGAWARVVAVAGDTLTGALTLFGAPTSALHAATKQYVDDHITDTTDAHAASSITNTPAGNIAAVTVQAAVNELDTEKANLASPTFTGTPAAPTAAAGTNTTQLATTAFVTAVTGSEGGFYRNRIINGDMRIDQRNAGAATAANASGTTYAADRWQAYEDTDGGFTTTAQATTTPPAGFSHYMRVTVTSADASLAAGQFALIQQKIEGVHCADLDFGLSTAKTVTLSFRVRSSLTGTFSGSLRNSASNRSYPFTYTISAANTWETKTVTIAGDTTGTWLTTTGIGMTVAFSLGNGSTYLGTAGAWAASALHGATGETSLIGTNGATWDITGVQLEPGSVRTEFERESYSVLLAKCQRYYEIVRPTVAGYGAAGTYCGHTQYYRVAKRTSSPTVAIAGTFAVVNCGQPTTNAAYSFDDGFYIAALVTAADAYSFQAASSAYFTSNAEL